MEPQSSFLVKNAVDEYLTQADWRVKANANQGFSLGGLVLHLSGKAVAQYWLNEVYDEEIAQAHRNADFHIHDLDMLTGYCAGWSLRQLLLKGFQGVGGRVESAPPRHFRSALGQIVNFFGTLQNEWAGAQALSSFDTYLAPFVRLERLSEKEVEQSLQEFVFHLNIPSRWGSQPPFTNLTFDIDCPKDLAPENPVIGGEVMDFCYGDLADEMKLINKSFLKIMLKGDAKGRNFSFPIPTYNITKDFHWDSEVSTHIFSLTAKYGTPYFQNFVNSDLDPHMVRSMCCRLQLDLSELVKRGNGLFGSAEQTGSIGVVTLNCARLGYTHKGDESGLFSKFYDLCEIAKRSLQIKRNFVNKMLDDGLYPYTKCYLKSLDNHFSTIGINGVNEMIRNFTNDKHDITDAFGKNFAERLLLVARDTVKKFQLETGGLFNLEATPAEGATYRFAKEDKKRFADIVTAGTVEAPYYTNSTQIPVGYTDDVFGALEHQDKLQTLYTGGTVFHCYMPEMLPNAQTCARLVKKVLTQFRLPYFTITPTYSICQSHGYIAGEQKNCPQCGKDTEIWTRVMGYHRPVSSFNNGKKSEYGERKMFILNH